MKIGIYVDIPSPEVGGASSLLKTIDKEIAESKDNRFEYVYIYNGKKTDGYSIKKNNRLYINTAVFSNSKRNFIIRAFFKVLRKLHIIKNKNYQFPLDSIADKEEIDLFWFTAPGIFNTSYPFIYTIWDLGHRTTPYFPEVSKSGWTWNSRENTYQQMVYKASYIITGNEEGKKEILSNYPMNPNKIRIVPFPVASFCCGDEVKPKFEIPEKYFFYPAQFWPHKNQIVILDALELLSKKNLYPVVYLTGSDKGNKDYIVSEVKQRKLEKQVIFTGFISDGELKYLYTHATAMIFASLMGPNNMPPIEATYLRCPVIITDLDGHKEQLKDTALYFNGYNAKELADCMELLFTDSNYRKNIIDNQKLLSKEFSKINYFENIKCIFDEFYEIRRRWSKVYIHL